MSIDDSLGYRLGYGTLSHMTKTITRQAQTGRFILGREAAEKISAVEGIVRSAKTGRLIDMADERGETGDARRRRIRAEFKK